MYGELASIKEVVDLTAEEAFEYAGTFLARLGYATLGAPRRVADRQTRRAGSS